jgi:hypothetical protein
MDASGPTLIGPRERTAHRAQQPAVQEQLDLVRFGSSSSIRPSPKADTIVKVSKMAALGLLLLLLLILGIGVARADYGFDFFLLVRQWGPTYCETSGKCNNDPV